jgi:hypothetical protein
MAGGTGIGLHHGGPTRRAKGLLRAAVPASAAALLEPSAPDVNDSAQRVRATVQALEEHYLWRQETRQAYCRLLLFLLYLGMFLLILMLQRNSSAPPPPLGQTSSQTRFCLVELTVGEGQLWHVRGSMWAWGRDWRVSAASRSSGVDMRWDGMIILSACRHRAPRDRGAEQRDAH